MTTSSYDWPVQMTHTVSLHHTTITITHRMTPSHRAIVERDSILDPNFTTEFDSPASATHGVSADHSSSQKPSSHHSLTSTHFTIPTQTSALTGFQYPYPVPTGTSSNSIPSTSSASQGSMHGMHTTILGLALTLTFLLLIPILALVGWFLIRRREAGKTKESEQRAIMLESLEISAPQATYAPPKPPSPPSPPTLPASQIRQAPQQPERSYLSRGSMRKPKGKPEGNYI